MKPIKAWLWGVLLLALVAPVSWCSSAFAGDRSADYAVLQRLEALEHEDRELRAKVAELEAKQAASTQEMPQIKSTLASVEETQNALEAQKLPGQLTYLKQQMDRMPILIGFRTGWGEAPFDLPGGVFYGAYIAHRLLTQEDGIPGGYVSGEMMVGVINGHGTVTAGNAISQLAGGKAKTFLNVVEVQPTVQYHLSPASVGLEALDFIQPYALVGPTLNINLRSSPLVAPGHQAGERFRLEDADFQPGVAAGLGANVSLTKLRVPALQGILDKTWVGLEWRFNHLGNGDSFNQYEGNVGFGF